MELNAEQIKKALECCAYGLCRDCVLYSDDGCGNKVTIGAIELITSQEQRIKELGEENAEVKENWQKLKDSYDNNDKEWREAYADSQSKWEKAYEKLELTLEGVMHFVDKWLDGAELEYDEANRAITMREKTLQIVEKLTEENERLMREKTALECVVTTARNQAKSDTVRKYREGLYRELASLGAKDKFNKEFFLTKADQIAKEMLEGANG